MRNKYTIDIVKKLFQEGNCVLLSKNYKRNDIKLDYICECGNKAQITLTCFLRGNRCKICAIKKTALKTKQRLKNKKNHHMYGKKHSVATKKKMSLARKKNKSSGNTGTKHSKESRAKISKNHADVSGNKNPNWKEHNVSRRYPIAFCKELKELIRIRDNHTCQLCGVAENTLRRQLSVHHINYNKEDLSPCNLISLCDSCHSKTNTKRLKWKKVLLTKLGSVTNKNMEMVLHDIKYMIEGVRKIKEINNHEKVKVICALMLDTCDDLFNNIMKMSDKPKKKK